MIKLPILTDECAHSCQSNANGAVQQRFIITPTMGTASDPGIDRWQTDLLVLTAMSHSHFTEGMRKIDTALSGQLAQALEQSEFRGHRQDQPVLVPGTPGVSGACHYLVVGLGQYRYFGGSAVCDLFGTVLDQALKLGAAKVTLPIPPNRQTSRQVNLKGTAAVIACRLDHFAKANPKVKLPLIEFFCTAQAARHLAAGLGIAPSSCQQCPLES